MGENTLYFNLDISTTLADGDSETAAMGHVQSWLEDNGYESDLVDWRIESEPVECEIPGCDRPGEDKGYGRICDHHAAEFKAWLRATSDGGHDDE